MVRSAVLDAGAEVWLVDLAIDSDADVDLRTRDELGSLLASRHQSLFWLTFDEGIIVEVCEQYRP